ncbi:MAG TPA: SDR family oxidoreductase [Thermoleophilaceae bacterium]|nr:SDR family oxidoreductase [Thermoleophilaceae bacterium]
MLLEGRNAVIYGGGGTIGSAVAEAFAREGARVHLAGRNAAPLEAAASRIRSAGGLAETAVVDALDEHAVDAHADEVVERFGSLDVSFNLISHGDVQGTPLAEMSVADFERPVITAVRTMFITTRAAARHMIRRRSGVILVFGGYGDPPRGYNIGGLQVAFQAQEALRRNLAAELGPYGIRAVTLQTSGIVDSLPEDLEARDRIAEGIAATTLLGRGGTLADVANAAVFAASDLAASMTATKLNISCGTFVD